MVDKEKDNIDIKDKGIASQRYNPVLFNNDPDQYLLYRRVENLTSALFLITSDVPEKESVIMSLRNASEECLKRITCLIGGNQERNYVLKDIHAYVLEISSFLTVAYWSKLITEMNTVVLQNELRKIQESLNSMLTQANVEYSLDPLVFTEVDLEARHIQNMNQMPKKHTATAVLAEFYKGVPKRAQPVSSGGVMQSIQSSEDTLKKKAERRETIIRLLREKNNLTIRDFSEVIRDSSEKTIQRELGSLVEEGLVKKEGERRWSTYSLPQ